MGKFHSRETEERREGKKKIERSECVYTIDSGVG